MLFLSWMSIAAAVALVAVAGCEDPSSSGTVSSGRRPVRLRSGLGRGRGQRARGEHGQRHRRCGERRLRWTAGRSRTGSASRTSRAACSTSASGPPSDPKPAQSAFAPNGVRPGTVSAYFPFDKMGASFNFLLSAPGAGCLTDAGFNIADASWQRRQAPDAVVHRDGLSSRRWVLRRLAGRPRARTRSSSRRCSRSTPRSSFTPTDGGVPIPVSAERRHADRPRRRGCSMATSPAPGRLQLVRSNPWLVESPASS